jgi:hypothetical protein
MRSIDRFNTERSCANQIANHFTKTIAAIAHWQKIKPVVRPRFAPATRDGACRLASREGALEFVWNDQDFQRHIVFYPWVVRFPQLRITFGVPALAGSNRQKAELGTFCAQENVAKSDGCGSL